MSAPVLPPRVDYWLGMVLLSAGVRMDPPDDVRTAKIAEHFAARLARAIDDSIAGKQSDADFLRNVSLDLDDPATIGRLGRIADAIDKPDWLDVEVLKAHHGDGARG